MTDNAASPGILKLSDALTLALKAFGAKDAAATELALSERTTALAASRLLEDVVIEHEARWMDGWLLSDSDLTGRAVFRQGDERLEVLVFVTPPYPRQGVWGCFVF